MLAKNDQVLIRNAPSFEAGPKFPEDVMGRTVFQADQEHRIDREMGLTSLG